MDKRSNHKSLGVEALVFAARSKTEEARLTRLIKEKIVRKIGPRLYTSLPKSEVAKCVREQWAQIVSNLYPNAVLSHRSALEYKPTDDGRLILTSTTNRIVKYPGLILEFVRGPEAQTDDLPFFNFHSASQARAFLENFAVTKKSSHRALSLPELEKKLNEILCNKGEKALNQLRDHARDLAQKLDKEKDFEKLNRHIGALLGTQSSDSLVSPIARARAKGRAFDATRLPRFDALLGELRATALPELYDKVLAAEHVRNKAFFEAYFSNYIEGTTFEIEEAEAIVFEKIIPPKRPKDAHDILSTFEIVSDLNEMRKTPANADDLLDLIVRRHRILMANRPEAEPGQFKDRPNRAGNSTFVNPDEIEGTFEKGYKRYTQLPKGLARAIFIMFLVAKVHPFVDGNGRIARIMMNAELHAENLTTIIIPNVFRDDYINGLRALTRRDRPSPMIQMLTRAQRFSKLDFTKYQTALKDLERRNWFQDPDDAKIVEG